MVTLRQAVPEIDFEQVARILSAADAEPVSAGVLHDQLRTAPAGKVDRRMVAVDGRGTVVGYSIVERLPWWGEGRYSMWVGVLPAHRGRGIGTALFDDALAFARGEGVNRLDASVREGAPEALHFAERRGFSVSRHLFSSTLELAAFDGALFQGTVGKVAASGIRFFSLAEAGAAEDSYRKLYELNRTVSLDIPGRERTFASYDDYARRYFQADWFRPDAQLLAADGDRWVGLASLQPLSAECLFNRVTGVDPEYRGRSIATALKLLSIDYARRAAYRTMRTNNDAENAPMLAVNRKLGYRPEPGLFLMMKEA